MTELHKERMVCAATLAPPLQEALIVEMRQQLVAAKSLFMTGGNLNWCSQR
jgi:hypothetical protein